MQAPGPVPRWSLVLGTAYLCVFATLAALLLGDIHLSLIVGVNDDAGYYFRMARNECLGHGGTFDWIHPTNGFNPLFKWMCTAAYSLGDVRSVDACYRVGVGI